MSAERNSQDSLQPSDTFIHRHIGPQPREIEAMLGVVGCASLDELMDQTVPASIRMKSPLTLGPARGEHELIEELRAIASKNKVMRSMIGMGYYDCITPPVILRNILENPGWYTQYTPYQAEISQGRLEALLNFQTMVSDLVALPLANASLLDEATAAAEAMHMCRMVAPWDSGPDGGSGVGPRDVFLVADDCHPQTINVVKTRARPLGIEIAVVNIEALFKGDGAERLKQAFGILLQYPTTDGRIEDYEELVEWVHKGGIHVVAATDLLACTLLRPPGKWGADICIGSAQRFGVPMGFGGPHAAFLATREEFARQMPGRIIGVSKDVHGRPAYRLAIQTREQHIRREKATSNICTAQALLANIASMYAVYHGPEGLRNIAERIHGLLSMLGDGLRQMGHGMDDFACYFDTLPVKLANGSTSDAVLRAAMQHGINLRHIDGNTVGVSLDETTTTKEIGLLLEAFAPEGVRPPSIESLLHWGDTRYDGRMMRVSITMGWNDSSCTYLTHSVFNSYHSETELLRYMKRLENRDLSLAQSMIPLGSCTMKLNGTSEMLPVTWPEFGRMHPFAPADQTQGYAKLFSDLEAWLAEITGFAAVSLQPNAGSQGEYAGLLAIRAYHEAHADSASPDAPRSKIQNPKSKITRDVCLIPTSAHGTNPASAVTAGFQVVTVACDAKGNIDIADLRAKAEQHAARLGALMVTYPSTHGVFEEGIREICDIVHRFGGQVYMDGANMNAQVGLCRPGDIGADVCHLNLHKTFCIPHGGGGPGVGPIGVAKHLVEFLPGSPMDESAQCPVPSAQAETSSLFSVPSSHAARSAVSGQPSVDRNPKSKIQNPKSTPGPVSAAPYGSASILPISWVYIALMGAEGLKRATEVAILNANYMAKRLEKDYPILYAGRNGRVAHEFIADCRQFEKSAGIKVEDIAKRLMDFGFHAPTMSFPVPGTLMIEPTESESKAELDRLCDALLIIREEIRAIEDGRADRTDNALKHAPHTAEAVSADEWPHRYSRQQAAYPAAWVRERKFWPAVGRIDNVWGDRNLMCSCPPMETYAP